MHIVIQHALYCTLYELNIELHTIYCCFIDYFFAMLCVHNLLIYMDQQHNKHSLHNNYVKHAILGDCML